jgi:hypothetical protein
MKASFLWYAHVPSFAEILQTLQAAVEGQEGARVGNNVLVVDDDALRIINACLPSNELLKAGFISMWANTGAWRLRDGCIKILFCSCIHSGDTGRVGSQ